MIANWGFRLVTSLSVVAVLVASCASPTTDPSAAPSVAESPLRAPSASPVPSSGSTPTLGPGLSPSPDASAAVEAYEHLSGVPTTAALAGRYPVAVMLDDSPAARPQAGLSDASVVYQAPAEGGIPRYMAIFQAGAPKRIGPVRSARLYFVRWASEIEALYAHVGGPLPLREYLDAGKGDVVNADAMRWASPTFARVDWRDKPHNSYTSDPKLRALGRRLGATDAALGYKPADMWSFRDGAVLEARGPDGGRIRVIYTGEQVEYRYDRATNTWLRSVDGRDHRDPAYTENRGFGAHTSGSRIAPTTVILMVVPIRRSSSVAGPALGRLEADTVGRNTAWIFADGRVMKGSWKKASPSGRTRYYDAAGAEISLPRGQIFVQVVPKLSRVSATVEAAA